MDNEIVELQTRLAFQEQSIIELSDVLARQQREIAALTAQLDFVQRQVRELTQMEHGVPEKDPLPRTIDPVVPTQFRHCNLMPRCRLR